MIGDQGIHVDVIDPPAFVRARTKELDARPWLDERWPFGTAVQRDRLGVVPATGGGLLGR